MRVMAHPFRVLPNGAIGTVDADGDDGAAQDIAVLLLTRPGERPLAPTFGVRDPAYSGVDPAELSAAVAVHGPDVTVESVTQTVAGPSQVAVDVTFSR